MPITDTAYGAAGRPHIRAAGARPRVLPLCAKSGRVVAAFAALGHIQLALVRSTLTQSRQVLSELAEELLG
jgi:hypothetical protein